MRMSRTDKCSLIIQRLFDEFGFTIRVDGNIGGFGELGAGGDECCGEHGGAIFGKFFKCDAVLSGEAGLALDTGNFHYCNLTVNVAKMDCAV